VAFSALLLRFCGLDIVRTPGAWCRNRAMLQGYHQLSSALLDEFTEYAWRFAVAASPHCHTTVQCACMLGFFSLMPNR
jgi:hypothetical protein